MARIAAVTLAMSAVAVPGAAVAAEDSGGALVVEDSGGLAPLPAPDGGPLYPRVRGHLPFGLTDTSWSESSDASRVLTADEVGQLHQAMGATIARMPMYWPHIEPSSGQRIWTQYDEVYRALVRYGVRPLWTIYQTPRFAVSGSDSFRCNGSHCDAEPAEGYEGAVRAFARDIARRYPLVAGFEWRNEPNHPMGFGRTRVTAERYASLLGAFHAGIKEGRPATRVIGGALVIDDAMEGWLNRLLEVGGAQAMDGLSFHPYAAHEDVSAFNRAFERLRSVLSNRGSASMRLVPDEIGASTDTGNAYSIAFDEDGQRARLLGQYRMLDRGDPAVPGSANVDAVVLYTGVDGSADSEFSGFGFLRRRGSDGRFKAKAVLCGFRAEIGGLTTALNSVVGACPSAAAELAATREAAAKAKKKAKKKKAKRCPKARKGRKLPKRCKKAKKKTVKKAPVKKAPVKKAPAKRS